MYLDDEGIEVARRGRDDIKVISGDMLSEEMVSASGGPAF